MIVKETVKGQCILRIWDEKLQGKEEIKERLIKTAEIIVEELQQKKM